VNGKEKKGHASTLLSTDCACACVCVDEIETEDAHAVVDGEALTEDATAADQVTVATKAQVRCCVCVCVCVCESVCLTCVFLNSVCGQITGKVVGIIQRNWRPYCGILLPTEFPKVCPPSLFFLSVSCPLCV
jgi:hypothetical protein